MVKSCKYIKVLGMYYLVIMVSKCQYIKMGRMYFVLCQHKCAILVHRHIHRYVGKWFGKLEELFLHSIIVSGAARIKIVNKQLKDVNKLIFRSCNYSYLALHNVTF